MVMDITEKNTKAEIFAAYQAKLQYIDDCLKENQWLQDQIKDLKSQLEAPVIHPLAELSSTPEHITVCIPYVRSLAQGNELQLALRGWAENFREEMNIVVIGDREPWMSELVDVIECKRVSDNPPLDVVNKMMLAIESDLVSEKFIWANDDQYLISPCMLADFETLKCTGKLEEKHFSSGIYHQNKKRTFDLLKKEGCQAWDFSSHTPFVFEKEKLFAIIATFNLRTEAHLVATLYFNYYFPGFVPYQCEGRAALENDNLKVGVYRKNADYELLKKLMPRKKIMSNSEAGWTENFAVIVNNRFPKKCRFEN